MHKGERRGRAIMVQGTSSSVGKSVVACALCRIFRQDGYSVAPFKSQNMSNNSCVVPGGGEIGWAQWAQAEAAGVDPSVLMNPILLKPKGDMTSQVVFKGRPAGDFEAVQYRREFVPRALPIVGECLEELLGSHDVVVIEGAGSPAEVNLKDTDIVNMRIAMMAGAPVLLVADIDRGGVFASIIGTLELLEEDERDMVAGFIINKFRGNKDLLLPGLDFLEKRTCRPVLGVIPFLESHDIPEEDAVVLEEALSGAASPALPSVTPGPAVEEIPRKLRVRVVRFPRISNFTDFDPLARAGGTEVRYVSSPRELNGADCVILPGTKNTIADLQWLRDTGLAAAILSSSPGVAVIGICGGLQMLGKTLDDSLGSESRPGVYQGLGLLDMTTVFSWDKTTTWSRGVVRAPLPLLPPVGQVVIGYEIHAGRTTLGPGARPLFEIVARDGFDCTGGAIFDGAVNGRGDVLGTYFHGLFDNAHVLEAFVSGLGDARGARAPGRGLLPGVPATLVGAPARQAAYDRLATVVRASLDMPRIYRIMGLS